MADSGPSGHSVFANAFLQSLGQMDEDSFTGDGLFDRVRRRVGGTSEQLPQNDPIRNSGDEGSDFVFFRHAPSAHASVAEPDVAPSVSSSVGSDSASKGGSSPPPRGGASKPNPPHPTTDTTAPSLDSRVEQFLNMGDQYWRNGKYDEAIAEYEEGLRVDPTNKQLEEHWQRVKKAKDQKHQVLQQ